MPCVRFKSVAVLLVLNTVAEAVKILLKKNNING